MKNEKNKKYIIYNQMAKIQPIYYIPPFLAIFGFGGIVCFHKSGAMSRIHRSFYRNYTNRKDK